MAAEVDLNRPRGLQKFVLRSKPLSRPSCITSAFSDHGLENDCIHEDLSTVLKVPGFKFVPCFLSLSSLGVRALRLSVEIDEDESPLKSIENF